MYYTIGTHLGKPYRKPSWTSFIGGLYFYISGGFFMVSYRE